VKTAPIAGKLVARRDELSPVHLVVDGIYFLAIRAAIVIKDNIGIHLKTEFMRRVDQV
jgi:hypothetical protein